MDIVCPKFFRKDLIVVVFFHILQEVMPVPTYSVMYNYGSFDRLAITGYRQWCSGGGATGAIAPFPIFQGGAPLQFLFHLFLVNSAYILQKLAFDLEYYS